MFKLVRVIFALVLLAGGLFLARNPLMKFGIQKGAEVFAGLPVKIDRLHWDLQNSSLTIRGLRVFGRGDFSDDLMLDASEVFAAYALKDLRYREIHLKKVRLNIDKAVIVQNADGRVNWTVLNPSKKAVGQADSGPSPKNTAQKPREEAAFKIRLDEVMLRLNKVVYKSYASNGAASSKEIPVNMSERFTDVRRVEDVVIQVAQELGARRLFGNVFNLNADFLRKIDVRKAVNFFREQIRMLSGQDEGQK